MWLRAWGIKFRVREEVIGEARQYILRKDCEVPYLLH